MSRKYGNRGWTPHVPVMDYEVVKVDGVPAGQAFTAFADSQVGYSPNANARLELAVRGDYPQLWACSFSTRNLGKCGGDISDTMKLTIRKDGSSPEMDVVFKWTVMYFGEDCDTAAPLHETEMDSGSCSYHEPHDWLNCEGYSHARGREKSHQAIADDDWWMEDVKEELHKSYFDHKDLMDTSELSTTAHTTHEMNGMSLTVLDSYEHLAAYAHVADDDAGTKTAVMRVASFHGEAKEMHAVVMEIAALDANRLVIDLRTNGGGHACHALNLAYLISNKYASPTSPSVSFDFKKSEMMQLLALNQSFFASAHPEFQLDPQNFLDPTTTPGTPFEDSSWYGDGVDGFTDPVSINCERYSSLLEYYEDDKKMHTRKLLNFDPSRIQVIVDAQCYGACAVFAMLTKLDGFGTLVGVGIDEVGEAPTVIGSDLDGLFCQKEAMKIEEDKYPEDLLFEFMPSRGQNLVIPLSRSVSGTTRRSDRRAAPRATVDFMLDSGIARNDYAEGKWYSGMPLYCEAIRHFSKSTSKYKPQCPHCTEKECSDAAKRGFGVGWAFFFIILGMLIIPCFGGIAYFFYQHGCSKDTFLGILDGAGSCFGHIANLCSRGYYYCKSLCFRPGGRYGTLSSDESAEGGSQPCCHGGFDWRSWVPGMRGSALEDQYSGLQVDPVQSELMPAGTGIPPPMNVQPTSGPAQLEIESNLDSYAQVRSDRCG